MYGQIHCVIRELVQKKFGNDMWETILSKSGLDEHQSFLMFNRYDDASTFKLVGAVSDTLEISVETVLEVFGEFFFDYCIRHGYDKMLQTLGSDIKSFIQNLDSLHSLLALSYKGISAPSFRCEDGPDGGLILHYYSGRPGLYPIVKGVLKAVARDLFDQSVEMSILEQNKEDIGSDKFQEHTAFLVQLRSNSTKSLNQRMSPLEHEKSLVSFNPEMVLLKASDFCSAFPYHVIFDRNLKIKQCGVLIQKHSCHVIKEGTPLNLAFDIVHPRMVISIDNIRKFINAVFLLAICSHKEKKRMVVKGQMIWIEDTQHMIFIGSPRLTSLNELMEMNVYLADIPLYDVTRELVLLNQQRIAEIDIAKRLDETTAQLKKTGQALEEEKRKTETLLHQMLPRKVATALTQGRTVEAEKFDQVTILFSDIVTFTNIASACSPMDIVDMLNEMYRRFDARTSQHNVYKVETIGDAYMIVSGVPEKTNFHAPPVADFAMDMLEDAGQVMSPATGRPLQIRVGVHTGPVVAGVVGVKMPRYCLFGDTVNTASRMESHGLPARIHLSASTRKALQGWGYAFHVRGEMEIKGKGKMCTYFLCGTGDRTLAEPDDDFTGMEVLVDTTENKQAIPTLGESCENIAKPEVSTTHPETAVTIDLLNEKEKETSDSESIENQLDSSTIFPISRNSSRNSKSKSSIGAASGCLNAHINGSENIENGGSGSLENSPLRLVTTTATIATAPATNASVDNVFLNVCCGFSSSIFSTKAYNAVDTNDNSDETTATASKRTTARRVEQSCYANNANTTQHCARHQSDTLTNIPVDSTSAPTNNSTSSDPNHQRFENRNKTFSTTDITHRQKSTQNNNSSSDINFPNDSIPSLQSHAAVSSPEPHPNHVFRCNPSKSFTRGDSIGKTGNASSPNGSAIDSTTNKNKTANASSNTVGESFEHPRVVTGGVSPDILPVECDSSTSLRTSWSHDHLLKVRKTRKKIGKKDRSKMCEIS